MHISYRTQKRLSWAASGLSRLHAGAWLLLLGWLSIGHPLNAQDLADLGLHSVRIDSQTSQTAGKSRTSIYTVQQITRSFNGLILKGYSTGNYRGGSVRFLEEKGWSDWLPLVYLEADTAPYFLAGYRGEVFRTDTAFELRFEQSIDADLNVLQIGVFDNREDGDYAAVRPGSEAPLRLPTPMSQEIVAPDLIPRGAWGAEPFIGSPEPLAPFGYSRLTFHHAACCAASTREQGIAQVKAIQEFHQDVRGWSDIGYHFLLDQQGRVYQGRPFLDSRTDLERPPVLALGAHVGGANTGNIGVSVLGCYHPAEGAACQDILSPAALDSLNALFAYLSERYGVEAGNLFGHRDQGSTACPGDNNYALIPSMKTRIRELILLGNQPIASAALTAITESPGVVRLSWQFTEIIDVVSYRIVRSVDTDTVTVFQSSNLGVEETIDPAPPPGSAVTYELYAVSSSGREQRLSTSELQIGQPDAFVLAPNFPNPFAASTMIRYYLEQDGVVSLAVYDARGRRVRSLVETYQEGDQWYAVGFEADRLASGSYYYRLRVEGFASIVFDETRPLMIVR